MRLLTPGVHTFENRAVSFISIVEGRSGIISYHVYIRFHGLHVPAGVPALRTGVWTGVTGVHHSYLTSTCLRSSCKHGPLPDPEHLLLSSGTNRTAAVSKRVTTPALSPCTQECSSCMQLTHCCRYVYSIASLSRICPVHTVRVLAFRFAA